MIASPSKWRNPSVARFARGEDPILVMQRECRKLVGRALNEGLKGPPFDVFALVEMVGARVVPRLDVQDARILPARGAYRFILEYNPNKSPGRLRFSIAHEIAHTLFPDCRNAVRNRERRPSGDIQEVETLCNIGAAEILMPLDSLPDDLSPEQLTFQKILQLQKELKVSLEAFLIRLIRLSQSNLAVFCASSATGIGIKIDYVVGSSSWDKRLHHGRSIPASSCLADITSVGWTESSDGEPWSLGTAFEAIGLPPFPGSSKPRIVGLLTDSVYAGSRSTFREVVGDATQPRTSGKAVLLQLVNDKARSWGGKGFIAQTRRKWPEAHESFKHWVASSASNLRLGSVHFSAINEGCVLASLVGQRGYGPRGAPRIDYAAVRMALAEISKRAARCHASAHMPRIGTGQAGGNWTVISYLVKESFLPEGVPVTVYLDSLEPSAQQGVLPL